MRAEPLFSSWLYLQCLEQCLAHKWCSINTCWMNKVQHSCAGTGKGSHLAPVNTHFSTLYLPSPSELGFSGPFHSALSCSVWLTELWVLTLEVVYKAEFYNRFSLQFLIWISWLSFILQISETLNICFNHCFSYMTLVCKVLLSPDAGLNHWSCFLLARASCFPHSGEARCRGSSLQLNPNRAWRRQVEFSSQTVSISVTFHGCSPPLPWGFSGVRSILVPLNPSWWRAIT